MRHGRHGPAAHLEPRGGRGSGRAGFTLVEVTVAMLILAMISTGIFSVVLTARTNQVRSERRDAAVVYADRLRAALKGYSGVWESPADWCQMRYGAACNSTEPPSSPSRLSHLPQDNGCGTGIHDHAFSFPASGYCHNAGCMLPAWFRAAPFGGRMCYQITNVTAAAGVPALKRVDIRVEWDSGFTCAAASASCP